MAIRLFFFFSFSIATSLSAVEMMRTTNFPFPSIAQYSIEGDTPSPSPPLGTWRISMSTNSPRVSDVERFLDDTTNKLLYLGIERRCTLPFDMFSDYRSEMSGVNFDFCKRCVVQLRSEKAQLCEWRHCSRFDNHGWKREGGFFLRIRVPSLLSKVLLVVGD